MNTVSTLRFLPRHSGHQTFALLAFAALLGCAAESTGGDSDRDPDEDERDMAFVDAGTGAGDATDAPDSAPAAEVVAWEDVAPALADLSGRKVEVVEGGAGSVTVVFESGLGDDWTAWDEVAREVSTRARVFAYSRPGYGASDPPATPRDAKHIAGELRALLEARGVVPPYVLVGHSFGGAYMELFAKAHPDEVSALVLVDSRHRDFTAACLDAGIEGCTIPDALLATLPQVQIDEVQAFAGTSDEIRAAGAFGRYPVRVLTATVHGFSVQGEALWESLHGSLAREAARGEQILFTGAGHLLQIERPHEVAAAILDVIPEPED